MVVTITHRGYIKRVPLNSMRTEEGCKGKIAVTTHDEDFIDQFFGEQNPRYH